MYALVCKSSSALRPSLGKQTPGMSPRAREQTKNLSTAIRDVLRGVRSSSRPGRVKLSKAAAVDESAMLHLVSGARMGLEVISALEDMVSDEGEVRVLCRLARLGASGKKVTLIIVANQPLLLYLKACTHVHPCSTHIHT